MKLILKFISFAGLGLTILPSLLVLFGKIDIETNKNLMVLGAVLWFATVPFWINQNKKETGTLDV